MIPSTADFDTGQRFGAYLLGKLVGRGGMGVVYEAQHVHLGRTVALKLLAPELSQNADFRARFLRESQLAATLEHPSIVTVYDAGEVNGVLYIAMRYVRGTDLAATLAQRGPLATAETLPIIEQVAGALDAAHAAGLVHRDVKPGNVLLEGDRCYLTDFGLTKRAAETRALTMSGQFLGTVDYVAPEQIEGGRIDGRVDVYALGCVLFECLTGSRPYPRDSQLAVLYAQINEPPPRPADLRPELPAAFNEVLECAMAKAPEGRYSTCSALAAAARQASSVAQAAPTGVRTAPTQATPAPALPTAPLPSEPRTAATAALAPTRRRSAVVPLAIVVVLVAAVLAAVLSLSGGGSNKTGPHVVGTPLQISKRPVGLVSRNGYLWVADNASGDVIRIKSDGSGRAVIHAGAGTFGLAANSTSVWAANSVSNDVTRIDTGTLTPTRFPVRSHPLFLTADDKVVAVANAGDGTVSRLDAGTGKPLGPAIRVQKEPLAIVIGGGSGWVANRDSGRVSRITGGRVAQTIDVGGNPVGLLYRDGVLWVANKATNTVQRINTANNQMTTTKVGQKPYALGYFGRWVWVTNRIDGTVMRLDPNTGRRVGDPISVPGDPVSMTMHDGDVWVTSNSAGTLTRIRP